MGKYCFDIPSGLPPDLLRDLANSCIIGGPDNMPFLCKTRIESTNLHIQRSVTESGCLLAPWVMESVGRLQIHSGTLMDRSTPYHFLLEMARGKINQIRNQSADWISGGLNLPDEIKLSMETLSHRFCQIVCCPESRSREDSLTCYLRDAHHLSRKLFDFYACEALKQQGANRLKTKSKLTCALENWIGHPREIERIRPIFDDFRLPLPWYRIQEKQNTFNWGEFDRWLDLADDAGLPVTSASLIDFSSSQLPAWLWRWDRDPISLTDFMCRFVERAVRRFRGRISQWLITTGSNQSNLLGLREEDLFSLTIKLGEVARGIDPELSLILGIRQPWGEYLADSQCLSPFGFSDNLIRSGLNVSAVNLEVIMGVMGRGTYCRDVSDFFHILQLYALLGVPLHITLGYPSSDQLDPHSDPEMATGAGWWKTGYDMQSQSDWAKTFGTLAISKPYVRAIHWTHFSDQFPHQFPSCGLIDHLGEEKPAMAQMRSIRQL